MNRALQGLKPCYCITDTSPDRIILGRQRPSGTASNAYWPVVQYPFDSPLSGAPATCGAVNPLKIRSKLKAWQS